MFNDEHRLPWLSPGDHLTLPAEGLSPRAHASIERARLEFLGAVQGKTDLAQQSQALAECFSAMYVAIARDYVSEFDECEKPLYGLIWNGGFPFEFKHRTVQLIGLEQTFWFHVTSAALRSLLQDPECRLVILAGTRSIIERYWQDGEAQRIFDEHASERTPKLEPYQFDTPERRIGLAATWELLGHRPLVAKLAQQMRCEIAEAWQKASQAEATGTNGRPVAVVTGGESDTSESPREECDEYGAPKGKGSRTSPEQLAIEVQVATLRASGLKWSEVTRHLDEAGFAPKSLSSRTGWHRKADKFALLYNYPQSKAVRGRFREWLSKAAKRHPAAEAA